MSIEPHQSMKMIFFSVAHWSFTFESYNISCERNKWMWVTNKLTQEQCFNRRSNHSMSSWQWKMANCVDTGIPIQVQKKFISVTIPPSFNCNRYRDGSLSLDLSLCSNHRLPVIEFRVWTLLCFHSLWYRWVALFGGIDASESWSSSGALAGRNNQGVCGWAHQWQRYSEPEDKPEIL